MGNPFFDFVRFSLGVAKWERDSPTETQWAYLHEQAQRQALLGVLFSGVEKLRKGTAAPMPPILMQWIGEMLAIKAKNELTNQRAEELITILSKAGFQSCVLKGQGMSLLYPQPNLRQSGDIDIWVDGTRDDIVQFLRDRGSTGSVDIKHCDWHIFPDVEVEVHFIPTWFYNPFAHKKLLRWLKSQKKSQFEHLSAMGFNTPDIPFNLVYSLIHIYRHLFDEGVGLRQMLDYYFILKHSTEQERAEAFKVLRSFRMSRFVGATMYVQQKVFLMEEQCLMCPAAENDGQFLLDEIMQAGNFGHFDSRIQHGRHGRWGKGWYNLKRNVRFLRSYPHELCWMPAWKFWHYCWRRWNRYL